MRFILLFFNLYLLKYKKSIKLFCGNGFVRPDINYYNKSHTIYIAEKRLKYYILYYMLSVIINCV